jgi:GDP-6-deoxy-D-talose 4-dehydrogenase
METALITGVKSFTGAYLKAALVKRGYRVHGTVYHANAEGDDVSSLDMRDREAVCDLVETVKPDVVFHLAAITFAAHDDAEAIYLTNIVGTRNLFEALTKCSHQPRMVIVASSANIYGQTLVNPIDESTSANPINDYAVSKYAMEHMAHLWMEHLPITIVRPFNYTGVGQDKKFLLPKIVDHYAKGKREIELGNLDIARDFSDVRFVAKAYAMLADKASAGDIFNVCSGQAHSLHKILDLMEKIAGYKIDVTVNPAFTRSNEIRSLCGCNAKLFQVVGAIKSYSLRETLSWMYDYHKIDKNNENRN